MSKIEQIVKDRLKDEFDKQLSLLQNNYTMGIEKLNTKYDDLLEALNQLEVSDATLFDFFEKTNGNIRIKTIESNWDASIDVTVSGLNPFGNNNIILNKNKSYKIILMAIEEDENNERKCYEH